MNVEPEPISPETDSSASKKKLLAITVVTTNISATEENNKMNTELYVNFFLS